MHLPIKYKLFFTLLLTSCLVSGGMFLFIQWNFDRGFLNYVNQQQLAEMEELMPRLAEEYARQGSWQVIQDNPRVWEKLLLSGRDNRGPAPKVPPPPGPALGPPPGKGARLALYDADRQIIIGPPDLPATNLKPVALEGQTIGYLSLVPPQELSEAGDLLFLEQQTQSFALVALSVAVLSLLISFPLTTQLLRPIKALTTGTRKLKAGQYQTRIQAAARDELGQLCNDFNSLAFTLEKNEQARKQWVADIAHELRTPLSVLQGDIEALQDGIREVGPKTLGALHDEARHLTRLVNDLYELSMSDIGALDYKMRRIDPLALFREAAAQNEARFAAKGLELRLDLPNQSCVMSADPDRLRQLFTNLLENSLRYTKAPGLLEVSATNSGQSLRIDFEDTPPGIDPSQYERLFERLYRGEQSRSRATGGAGLGLAICKNIVEAHRGEINAGPSKHGGLHIRLDLPLSTGEFA
ncbi:two-component sensor histidine kinase [Desulfuromonas versatilis]|uniref:histidine kinase n=1 Tax=Desulfuromonas versatilis TaxID=2802975 RepID=A0ABM8HYY1_9BACT|nr:ATP-binding protein [Desulfuromonas versatilis]BCR06315.1 two-component sensor histidine kinase [Desulfuromonas versatilis]